MLVAAACEHDPRGDEVYGLFFIQARADSTVPRDVVYVLDVSGSMGGGLIEPAREALAADLGRLAPDDRYAILTFDSTVEAVRGELVPPSVGLDVDRARVLAQVPGGATNLDGGLQAALAILSGAPEARHAQVVLLTDGMPTAGQTDPDVIVASFLANNSRGARLHVLGMDLRVRQSFLAELAQVTGGSVQEAWQDGDGVGERIQSFLARVGRPVVEDVRLGLSGFEHSQALDGSAPAIMEDGTLLFAFRDHWPSDSEAVLLVEGVAADGPVRNDFTIAQAECTVFRPAGAMSARIYLDSLLARDRGGNVTLEELARETALAHQLASPYTQWRLAPTGASADVVAYARAPPTPPPEAPPSQGQAGDDDAKASAAAPAGLLAVLVAAVVARRPRMPVRRP